MERRPGADYDFNEPLLERALADLLPETREILVVLHFSPPVVMQDRKGHCRNLPADNCTWCGGYCLDDQPDWYGLAVINVLERRYRDAER